MSEHHITFPYRDHPNAQRKCVSIHVPSRSPATIDFTIHPDHDPANNGIEQLNLISLEAAKGYPVAHATVTSTHFRGYASMYGWIQVFAESPTPFVNNDTSIPWQMDFIPIYNKQNGPFTWFGPEPTLYDAPFRPADMKHIDWVARSFLCYIKDELLTRHPIPVAAFEWGFWKEEGRPYVKALEVLEVEAWNEHLRLFRDEFKEWKFDKV